MHQHIRSSIEVMLESGLEAFLNLDAMTGHRHGHHDRHIIGTFSPSTVSVPRPAGRGRRHDAVEGCPGLRCKRAGASLKGCCEATVPTGADREGNRRIMICQV